MENNIEKKVEGTKVVEEKVENKLADAGMLDGLLNQFKDNDGNLDTNKCLTAIIGGVVGNELAKKAGYKEYATLAAITGAYLSNNIIKKK